uniref:SCP domain-containing protein n=1 Tax=Trichuris muris TaxID=70415 RepID=A0A5S6QW14_TRIMR
MHSTVVTVLCIIILLGKVSSQVTPCFTAPASNSLDTVQRLYSYTSTDNRLESDAGTISSLQMQGFANMGSIGKWVRNGAHTVPQTSAYYVMNEDLLAVRRSEGYHDQGIVGYAVNGPGVCGAAVPIYEFWRSGFGIVQVPASQIGNYLASSTGYVWQGIAFAIWPL